MAILSFNADELKLVESFLQAATDINDIYENLYNLEINGQKDSDEYNKLLKALTTAIKIENDRIKKANLSYEQCKKIILLLENTPKRIKINNLDCMLFQQYEDQVIRRIINTLTFYIKTDINYPKECCPKQIVNLSQTFKATETSILEDMVVYSKIDYAIDQDILSLFLSILLEYISNKKYCDYRNQLIKSKYFVGFINKNIEKQLLSNDFNIIKDTYINSSLTANILGKSEKEYDGFKSLNIKMYVLTQIQELLKITDADYKSPQKNIESILRQCYIRALLTMVSDDTVYELNEKFHEIIDSPAYIKMHPSDRISENAIMLCFKCRKYDRGKRRILSINTGKQE